MDLKNIASLSFFLPEIILSATILLLIVLDLLARSKDVLGPIAAIGCVIALIVTFDLYSAQPGLLFHRMIVLDRFSLFFKIFALAATILTIWMSLGNDEIKQFIRRVLHAAADLRPRDVFYGLVEQFADGLSVPGASEFDLLRTHRFPAP
jgi:NADH:ubiquinone oxidoreductase subunit 2 (subunit N)